uniref:C-type lectin domain-containing protein n=1 Tax=Hucho hucho TaxID=62062 RepID=A0A4W5KRL3_9TELE
MVVFCLYFTGNMELRVTLFLLSGQSSQSYLCVCVCVCYQFVKISRTWAEAQSYCREKYIDLATIDNTEDMDRLRKVIDGSSGIKESVWIGLHDNINSWKWSLDNSDYYTDGTEYGNWYANEPNNFGSSQYCVVIEENGHWNDIACAIEFYAVCYDGERQLYL